MYEKREYRIPNSVKKLLVINDIHIPFQDKHSLKLTLKYAEKQKIQGILINGDLTDCHKLSKFEKNPFYKDFRIEVEETKQFFERLKKKFKRIPIYYKIGNHERRIERTLLTKLPEFYGLDCLEIPNLFELKKYSIKYIPDDSLIRYDKWIIVHGDELRVGGADPCKSVVTKWKQNIIFGHLHTSDVFNDVTLDNSLITAIAVGHLGDKHPKYCVNNKWIQGFLILNNNGSYENKKILKGEII